MYSFVSVKLVPITTTLRIDFLQVCRYYANGTVRHGPLHQISLVGTVHEEVGGFFPDLLARLETNPFLKEVGNVLLPNCIVTAPRPIVLYVL